MKQLGMVILLTALALSVFGQSIGDVNGNETVDILDALMIAQYYIGIPVDPFDIEAADTDGDGTVSVIDALLVAQFYVGLINVFPGDDSIDILLDRLEQKRRLWDETGLREYDMTYRYNAFGFPHSSENFLVGIRLFISMDDIFDYLVIPSSSDNYGAIKAVSTETGEKLDDSYSDFIYPINKLFSSLSEWIKAGYKITTLEFDDVYSYPTRVAVDPIPQALDDEFAIDISSVKCSVDIRITNNEPDDGFIDPVRVGPGDLIITDHNLSMKIIYGGGCFLHEFVLCAEETFMESYPVQVNLYLYDMNPADFCAAIVTERTAFNLKPLADHYKELYGAYDTIQLNIYGSFSSKPPTTILYSPQNVVEKTE